MEKRFIFNKVIAHLFHFNTNCINEICGGGREQNHRVPTRTKGVDA